MMATVMTGILGAYKSYWRERVCAALQSLSPPDGGGTISEERIVVQYTQSSDHGDIAIPLFPFAKQLAASPPELAARVQQFLIAQRLEEGWGQSEVAGGYLNIRLDRSAVAAQVFAANDQQTRAALRDASPFRSRNICLEYSSPNTNKPLHLGHLRNNVLGESMARILTACGAAVTRINLINDRGIHICKSMAAYQRFGNGTEPRTSAVRGDTFVGDYYVRFNTWQAAEPAALAVAQELLRKWEQGDKETRVLWQRMRAWTLDGIRQTYRRTGVRFDVYQYESDTYLHGKEIVQRGVDTGVFTVASDGSVEIALSDINLDTKKLLRSDGTAIYLTQDLGTAVQRYQQFGFDRLIYVVANEQEYHFQVLFEIIARLGLPFADRLFHRSYGLVELPDGKMKSRAGTVVDADALIDDVRAHVAREMQGEHQYRAAYSAAQKRAIAEKIALSSIHYWLLKFEPHKNITFDTKQSISFTGNSGAYILYTIARLHHLLLHGGTATDHDDAAAATPAPEIAEQLRDLGGALAHATEWRLLLLIAQFPEIVLSAAHSLTPFPITQYLYQLAHTFSAYYHDVPIAVERDPGVRRARLRLIRQLLTVLEACCDLLVMPTVTDM